MTVRDDPDAWLESQRAFWRAWQESAPDDLAGLGAAWSGAVAEWWSTMASEASARASALVRSAAEHTVACAQAAEIAAAGGTRPLAGTPGPWHDAVAGWASTARTLGADPHPEAVQGEYATALAEWLEALAGVRREAETAAARRLAECARTAPPPAPREAYEICLEAAEQAWQRHAAGEDFSRRLGRVVNAALRAVPPREGGA